MKKKIFTLMMLAVTGVMGAWADDEISCSAYLTATAGSATESNCTLKYYSDEGSGGTLPAGEASDTYYYAKMNNDKNYYELTLKQSSYTKFIVGDEITVYLYANGSTQAYKVGKTASTAVSASNKTTGKVYEVKHTLTAKEIEEDGTVRIYRNSSNTYFAGISVSGKRVTETFTVTFEAGSNGTCETQSLTEESVGAGVVLPDVKPNQGFVFNGWYTEASEGEKAGNAGDTYYPTASVTLHAQYVEEAAPTISINNTTVSTPRGLAITLTATTTGAPTPTVTWYQSESVVASNGTEKGEGNTYSPDVTTEGTFYYYAVANNGVGTEATSEVVTVTVTNPDKTIEGNSYYVEVSEIAVADENIICDDITMQFVNSGGGFKAGASDGYVKSINSKFVAQISGDDNSSGWSTKFTPTKSGILNVGVIIAGGKTFSITDVTGFSYQANLNGKGTITSHVVNGNSYTTASDEKIYGVVTITVAAGKEYVFTVGGSKMGIYGFEFEPAEEKTITLNGEGYATYSGYYDVEVSGADAYTATLSGNAITCTKIDGNKVPGGAGVLLYGEKGATVTLTPMTTAADELGENDLKATTDVNNWTVEKNGTCYALDGNTFKQYTGDALKANKAYLDGSTVGEARSIDITFGDDTTGIKVVTNAQNNQAEYFDLQGRRVAQPTKGLYVIDGKKVIIK